LIEGGTLVIKQMIEMKTGGPDMAALASSTKALHVPRAVPFLNPVVRRLMRAGLPFGPNTLLTVRGRSSGLPRTTPVAVVEVGGRRWLIGTFGDVNWVRNLRAAGEGVIKVGGRHEAVTAVELSHDEATEFFGQVLGPYVRRTRLAQWLLRSVLGAGGILDDPADAARRRPVFELRPKK
jgi:deazaflavin-dependent oxidoreductase (nitroreductase family)